jgi:hypothetical protein
MSRLALGIRDYILSHIWQDMALLYEVLTKNAIASLSPLARMRNTKRGAAVEVPETACLMPRFATQEEV